MRSFMLKLLLQVSTLAALAGAAHAASYVTTGGVVVDPIQYNPLFATGDHSYSGTNLGPGANLSSVFLNGADLTGADLTNTNLLLAQFFRAWLIGADLTSATATATNFERADLTSANLTGANLAGADLERATLTDADLTGAGLQTANLTNAILTGVTSGGITGTPSALPTGTILTSGYLIGPGVNLTDANLAGANLVGADLTGADLAGANLTGATSGGLTGTPSTLPTGTILANGYLLGPGVDLTGADLTDADLTGADLTGADLTGVTSGGLTSTPSALPTGTILANGYLVGPGVDLTGANLAGADLTGADLTGADLTGVTSGGLTGTPSVLPTGTIVADGYLVGPGVNLLGLNFAGANFTDVDLTGANLLGANLTGADLTGATLAGANFTGADLTGATLAGANLTGANFTLADLPGTDLTGADLTGANLTLADLTGSDLTGAISGELTGTPTALPTGTILANAYLVGPGVNLAGANLAGADLTGADLTGVTSGEITGTPTALPTGTILANGYLLGPGVDLTDANLAGADLTGADLTGANLSGVTSGELTGTPTALPTGTILANGYLVGPGVDLTGVDLTGADLTGADLTGTDLSGADLSGVTSGEITGTPSALPTGTVLANGYLAGPGVDLTGADLTGADLTGVDLAGANLTNAVGLGTITGTPQFNLSTNFTGTGFDPFAAGWTFGAEPGVDTDGDGLLDTFEAAYGFNPLVADEDLNAQLDGQDDADADGLTNVAEQSAGTNPTNADTDGDGLLDGSEVANGYDPVVPTTLPPGYINANGYIVGPGVNLVGANLTGADLAGADLRGADLTNAVGLETTTGTPQFNGSTNFTGTGFDPFAAGWTFVAEPGVDTDGDGLFDTFEAAYGFDPLVADQDLNAQLDGQDDADADGLTNAAEQSAGTNPTNADTDGDGLLDGDETGGEGGSGTFEDAQTITTTADGATEVVAADVDGDGDIDVLSASNIDDTIAWHENTDGFGTSWTTQTITTTTNGAVHVFATDVDGDEDIDVLSASYLDDTIAWYENTDGSGTSWATQTITTTADGAVGVFATDVDGDEDIDVLSASNFDNTIAWYENTDGSGTFGAPQTIGTKAGAFSVSAVDLDGDGDVDVLAGSGGETTSESLTIVWYENTDGSETFGPAQSISGPADAVNFFLTVADVDGDGALDLLTGSFLHDTIAWYEQQLTGTNPTNADTDGDGLLDGSEVANGYDPLSATTLPPGYINANGYIVGPGVNLVGADLAGADLTSADLSGVTSGEITGTPSALPTGTVLANGYLAGPGVDLTGADLTGADLTGVDLAGANLTNAVGLETTTGTPQFNGSTDFTGTGFDPFAAGWTFVAEPGVDTDGDGLFDTFEAAYGFDPLVADEDLNAQLDGQDDADADGLTNVAEQSAGTNPTNADTDGDGLLDGSEVLKPTALPLPTETSAVTALTWSPTLNEFVFNCCGRRFGRLSSTGDVSVFGLFDRTAGGLAFMPGPGSELYAIDREWDEETLSLSLRRIDPASGSELSAVPVTLSGFTSPLFSNDLAFHPQSGVLFSILFIEAELEADDAWKLVTLDPATGVATVVGDISEEFEEMTFDETGTLFALSDATSATPSTLFTLNTTDAQATAVLSLPNGFDYEDSRNIAFNPDDGLLYHYGGGGVANQPIFGKVFERVDLAGPSVTPIPLLHQPNFPTGIAYLPATDDFLVATDPFGEGALYRLTPGGSVTFIGYLDQEVMGLARATATTVYSIGAGDEIHTVALADASTLSSVLITLPGESVNEGRGLARRSDGIFFALLVVDGLETPLLATLDPLTGTATSLGDTGNLFETLAFDAADTLYAATDDDGTSEQLFTLDTTTAGATLIGELGAGDQGEAIVFRSTDGLELLYHLSGNGPPSDPIGGEVFQAFTMMNLDPLVPTTLPAGYINANGYVVGPGVDLTGANLAGVDLSGVDLTGVTLGDVTIVTGISPDSGSAAGNIPLTLSGSGFGVSGTVTVDGSLCSVLTYTDTEITCDLPPGVGSSVPVVVVSSAGKTSNTTRFTYLGSPPTEVPGLGSMMQMLLALLLAMLSVRQFGRLAKAKH